jgi:hypothetical protein
MNASPPDHDLGRTLRAPAWLAATSLCGLVLALLGDGWFDVVGWLAAGTPIVAVAWALAARRK